jgi:Fe-S-cluster-containing hydrogenase component 2
MPRKTPLMIYITPGKCDFCGCCVGVCPEDAIELMESRISIIDERCTNCSKCVWACPWEVIKFHREGVAELPSEQPMFLNTVQTEPGKEFDK